MITEESYKKKIIPQDGYLLTDGETITDILFIGKDEELENWWEIPYIEDWQNIINREDAEPIIKEFNNSFLQERIYKLENMVDSLKNPYSNKTEDFPEGDYMNPICILDGGIVTQKNKWYYINDKDRPHRAIIEGFATQNIFYDKSWFAFI